MELSSQVLFFFSALGAFNGIVLAAYLWFRESQKPHDKWLALLLLMIAIRVGKSVFFFFSPDLAKAYLQLGLSACLLIGPCIYLFTLCIVKAEAHSRWSSLHVVMPTAAITLIGGIFPYQNYPGLWGGIIYKAVNYYWLGYLLLSLSVLFPILKRQIQRNTLFNPSERMAVIVYTGTSVIFLAYFSASYTSYIAGALSFSFVLYLSLLLLSHHLRDKKQRKYKNNKIAPEIAQLSENKLKAMLDEEPLYTDPNLSLAKLAKRLGESPHSLSQLLNDNLDSSFADYINQKRIEYAKTLLKAGQNKSIELIAEQSGYNSLSTFYSAFKKFTGQTPAKYRDNQ